MNDKILKTLLFLLLIFLYLGFDLVSAENEFRVSFLNVGQGDASLIQTIDGKNILIDGGPDDSVVYQLSQELSWLDRTIDLMILTHPHADHINGLNEVLDRYDVKKILYTGAVHTSPTYINWLKLVKEKNIPIVIIDKPQKIKLDEDCFIDILYPTTSFLHEEVSNLNNTSIVFKLTYKKKKFLFTGDIEEEIESDLLDNKIDLSADILKIAHHGSDTSTILDFLKAVNPSIAVIQVGEDNKFNHPSIRVINRLERAGVDVLRNDKSGTIRMTSDGNSINIY